MIRVLDPATAVVTRRKDENGNTYVPRLRATAYVADQLLVRGQQLDNGIDQNVQTALGSLGWSLEPASPKYPRTSGRPSREPVDRGVPPREFTPREQWPDVGVKLGSQRPRVFRIVVSSKGPAAPPDAWVALQTIASVDEGSHAGDFELNHVLAATTLSGIGGYWSGIGGYWSGIGGYWSGIGGYWSGIGGYWSGIGTSSTPAEYGVPGLGGRSPVALIMADPALNAPRPKRPPVVVMPDTGIGVHSWFRDLNATPILFPPPLLQGVAVLGTPADIDDGVTDYLTGDLERLAGHGTFIAGIVRQACPAAHLESHAVMTAAGVMFEDELVDDLHALLERQVRALAAGGAGDRIVDVLTLSVGYYHEDGGDADDASIAKVLRDLGRVGVLVVAGAGNDATSEPMLPAGFAGPDPHDPDALPLISVGSLNPNGTTVSLFSNAGSWVTTYRSGAAIVSTLPLNVNASVQASTQISGATAGDGLERSTIDRDDYSGGFGVWSGTSFATPVLAGELAQALVDEGTETIDLKAMRERGWKALERVVHWERRS